MQAEHQERHEHFGRYVRDNNIKLPHCEICGTLEQLTLHHVLPQEISYYMPNADDYKKRATKVILCRKHHNQYEVLAAKLKQELCDRLKIPFATSKYVFNPSARAKKHAFGLFHFSDKMSPQKQIELKERIADIMDVTPEEVTNDFLEKIVDTRSTVVNPDHVQYGKVIGEKIDPDELFTMWHQHWKTECDKMIICHAENQTKFATNQSDPKTSDDLNKSIKKVLQFYADGGLYGRNKIMIEDKEVEKRSRIEVDGGRRARELLGTWT